jgi:formylglycine-generating enzyme required for sulfatase activity
MIKRRRPRLDFAWCDVPAGQFIWQDGEKRETGAYRIARYPITNAQYRAFTGADDYADPEWWRWWREDVVGPPPEQPQWPADNRPRVHIAWVEAVAFCLWLTARLRALPPERGGLRDDEVIRLPTELEWEKAARGTDGREFPWGNGYVSGHANIDETYGKEAVGKLYLRETTAVGLYPSNRSPYGAMDCSGNVWEWCLNKAGTEDDTDLGGDAQRALRGGGWDGGAASSRASSRSRCYFVVSRVSHLGCRVVRAGPIR